MKIGDIWYNDIRPVRYGGVYHPVECVTDELLSVIIPYRDREKHLIILLNNLHHMLQRKNLSYAVFVVELALPTRFNRGFLMNLGYIVSIQLGEFNCFVFHNVDSIPMHEKNVYRCGQDPVHLSSNLSKYTEHNGLPYPYFFGGVVKFSDTQFQAMIGFSNVFFGWGGEDDNLYSRVIAKHMKITRFNGSAEGRYYSLPHDHDWSNPKHVGNAIHVLLHKTKKNTDGDGLTSIKYKLKGLEFREFYTCILAETSEQYVRKRKQKLH